MSLLDGVRSSPALSYTTNWNRAIWKEQSQKLHADVLRHKEDEDAARRAATAPSRRRSTTDELMPPKTPVRSFVRVKDAIVKRGPPKMVGAFDAHVTANPDTGFLPKPNYYVPGIEPSLGPVPKPLRKGHFPPGYVFADQCGLLPQIMWPNNQSQTPAALGAERRRLAAARTANDGNPESLNGKRAPATQLTSTASAPELATAPDASRAREPVTSDVGSSGIEALIADARVEGHQRLQQKDASYGATSWFLATKERNTTSWCKSWKQITRGDSGKQFYWGC